MKKFTSIAIACLLALSVVPAMAADQTGSDREPVMSQAVETAPVSFQALSKLAATERQGLVPLTDKELASIEGEGFFNCNVAICVNFAAVSQSNQASYVFYASQYNSTNINQNIGRQSTSAPPN
jgi:hypothetical protein